MHGCSPSPWIFWRRYISKGGSVHLQNENKTQQAHRRPSSYQSLQCPCSAQTDVLATLPRRHQKVASLLRSILQLSSRKRRAEWQPKTSTLALNTQWRTSSSDTFITSIQCTIWMCMGYAHNHIRVKEIDHPLTTLEVVHLPTAHLFRCRRNKKTHHSDDWGLAVSHCYWLSNGSGRMHVGPSHHLEAKQSIAESLGSFTQGMLRVSSLSGVGCIPSSRDNVIHNVASGPPHGRCSSSTGLFIHDISVWLLPGQPLHCDVSTISRVDCDGEATNHHYSSTLSQLLWQACLGQVQVNATLQILWFCTPHHAPPLITRNSKKIDKFLMAQSAHTCDVTMALDCHKLCSRSSQFISMSPTNSSALIHTNNLHQNPGGSFQYFTSSCWQYLHMYSQLAPRRGTSVYSSATATRCRWHSKHYPISTNQHQEHSLQYSQRSVNASIHHHHWH